MAITANKQWEFSDKSRVLITSQERVNYLKQNKCFFEASAVQVLVVEAMLFFSILSSTTIMSKSKADPIKRKLSSLTFGGLIERAKKYSLLNLSLIDNLNKYKEKRNFLVHHFLVELHDINYPSLLQEGDNLINSLFELTRSITYIKMKSIGHKDADKFKN